MENYKEVIETPKEKIGTAIAIGTAHAIAEIGTFSNSTRNLNFNNLVKN